MPGEQRLAERIRVDDLDDDFDDDEFDAEELEEIEEELVDAATAARPSRSSTPSSSTARARASSPTASATRAPTASGRSSADSSRTHREMFDADGGRRKLIIFTEHRDTLDYLVDRLRTLLGRPDAVVAIHGGVRRARSAERSRRSSPRTATATILLATDAAGEGLNLQRAHLMVNYDLPWNPNRIEQRFGRIHRIGQKEVCRLWNLVADNTREGEVLPAAAGEDRGAAQGLRGKVFDVLGEAFSGADCATC